MNYNYLKDNIKEKGFSIEKMAQKVGMTPQGLRASMKNDTLTVHTLEKISYILEVPIYDLMNEQISKKQTGARSNEDYLQQIRNSLEDIAQALGYPHPSNLTTALNRIADAIENKE